VTHVDARVLISCCPYSMQECLTVFIIIILFPVEDNYCSVNHSTWLCNPQHLTRVCCRTARRWLPYGPYICMSCWCVRACASHFLSVSLSLCILSVPVCICIYTPLSLNLFISSLPLPNHEHTYAHGGILHRNGTLDSIRKRKRKKQIIKYCCGAHERGSSSLEVFVYYSG
jgi:hypothetical protein